MSKFEIYRRRAAEIAERGTEAVSAQEAATQRKLEVDAAKNQAAERMYATPQYQVIAELLHPDTLECLRVFIEKKRPRSGGEQIGTKVDKQLKGYKSIFPWKKKLRIENTILYRVPVYVELQSPILSDKVVSTDQVTLTSQAGVLPHTFVTFYDTDTFATRYLDEANTLTEAGANRVIMDYFHYCESVIEKQYLIAAERMKAEKGDPNIIEGYTQIITEKLLELGITTHSEVDTHPTVGASAFGVTAKIVAIPYINGEPQVQIWVHLNYINKPVDSVEEALQFLANEELRESSLVK